MDRETAPYPSRHFGASQGDLSNSTAIAGNDFVPAYLESAAQKTPQTFSMLIDYGFIRGNSEVATFPIQRQVLILIVFTF